MQVAQLENIAEQLRSLKSRLERLPGPSEQSLGEDSEYIRAARECDFMLPAPLTLGTLSETVDRKLKNVAILVERARNHESLPEDAQAAAEQEYTMLEEDYTLSRSRQNSHTGEVRTEKHGRQ